MRKKHILFSVTKGQSRLSQNCQLLVSRVTY